MNMKIKIDNQIFDVEVEDVRSRPILVRVNGETLEVFPEQVSAASSPSQVASSLSAAPAGAPAAAVQADAGKIIGGKGVVAPIPGTIVGISVKVGENVQAGQELCSLEAMKMKNAIRATRSGTVAAIHISTGDKVRHGQLLLEFSE